MDKGLLYRTITYLEDYNFNQLRKSVPLLLLEIITSELTLSCYYYKHIIIN